MKNIDTMSVNAIRVLAADAVQKANSGHPGLPLGCAAVAYELWAKDMKHNPANPDWADRDRFILSKGHAAIAYAPVLCDKGFNDVEMLKSFNLSGSKMGMHLDSNKVVGVDASTGSLGHGLSIGVGTALAARLLKKDYKTFVKNCLLVYHISNKHNRRESAK